MNEVVDLRDGLTHRERSSVRPFRYMRHPFLRAWPFIVIPRAEKTICAEQALVGLPRLLCILTRPWRYKVRYWTPAQQANLVRARPSEVVNGIEVEPREDEHPR
jgi:hypothetical protein